jgi:hypothetical protein
VVSIFDIVDRTYIRYRYGTQNRIPYTVRYVAWSTRSAGTVVDRIDIYEIGYLSGRRGVRFTDIDT